MNVLIVGAGAVGQVYALHLQRAGARITAFVKPKYAAEARAGYVLHPLKGPEAGQPARLECEVVTTPEEVGARLWDQVWLCMSSTALKGPWLEPLLAVTGEATVVSLQPGVADKEYLEARMPADRLVCGLIPMVSFQSPLPGEDRAPGVAFWWPPLSKNPFSGVRERTDAVVDALNAGGWPSKRVPDVGVPLALGSGLMMPAIVGLELAGWSFAAFGEGERIRLASRAMQQATEIRAPGQKRALVWLISRPWVLRLILWLGKRRLPFDLEVYLKYHFTKVGDQTRATMADYQRLGEAAGKPVDAIRRLAAGLPKLPG